VAVQRGNVLSSQPLAEGHDDGVREVHRQIGVFFHERDNALEVAGIGLHQDKAGGLNPSKQVLLRRETLIEHVHGLRHHRHGREERPAQLADEFQGGPVIGVASVEQRD
jgi:hypothetical protein